METSVQRIENTRLALTEALNSSDWERIGDLDQVCRQQIEDALVDSIGQEEALRTQLEMLMDVYRQLTEACMQAREEIAHELIALQKASQGAKVYQLYG